MSNILFLVTGDLSFDEMSYLDSFLNQLPTRHLQHHVIAPPLPMSCLNPRENVRIQIADQFFNYQAWKSMIYKVKPDLVILLDPVFPLASDEGRTTYFELEWLNDLSCPLAIMDYQEQNLYCTRADGSLVLSDLVNDPEAPNIYPDAIIKVCPPEDAVAQTPDRKVPIFNWGFYDDQNELSLQLLKTETRNELACPEDTHIVTLKFPFEALFISSQKDHELHFRTIVEILIHYLNQFEDQKFQLYVINMGNIFSQENYDNVTLKVFQVLQLDLQNRLIGSSELFFTQSTTHAALIQSTFKGIPAIVLGNSVDLSANEFKHSLNNLSPFIQLKLAQLKEENPEILFPYLSYPIRTEQDWEEIKKISLFASSYFFCLVDIFDEDRTLRFLKKLFDPQSEARQYLNQEMQDFKKRKLSNTRDAGHILKRLLELNQLQV